MTDTTTRPYTTWRTVYREVDVVVTLYRDSGKVHSVCNPAEYDLTRFMTADQLTALAKQCREEMESDN